MVRAYQKFKQDYQGKRVLVMGLGVQGGGVGDANFFVQLGCQVVVTDLKPAKELKSSLNKLDQSIDLVLGEHREKDFKETDLIIKNPAVPQDSVYLKIALENKVPVKMSTSLFARYCPAKIIGITGTRGKSTTTELIFNICQKTGKTVLLGGNVRGVATLPLLKKVEPDDWVVLELSSWELSAFHQEKISPAIAVFTNIYPDHLNRYLSMADYMEDKAAIFKYQRKEDFLIINQDNPATKNLAKQAFSKVVWFSQNDWPLSWPLKLRGVHNRENAAAALKTVLCLGVDKDLAKKVIANFRGLPYRLETVATIKGIEFINDTTSTTPAAAEKALAAIEKPIILLAGGASKNLKLNSLAQKIIQQVKAVLLLEGTATDELQALIKKIEKGEPSKIAGRFNDFQKAISKAYSLASSGEVVLLSPGCASFGMFENEFDRGDQFNQIVRKLT